MSLLFSLLTSLADTVEKPPYADEQQVKKEAEEIAAQPLAAFDWGLFAIELLSLGIAAASVTYEPTTDKTEVDSNPQGQIEEATYGGTQLAITAVFNQIEKGFVSWCDVAGVEPSLPVLMALNEKRAIYQWSDGSDKYPPHLAIIPSEADVSKFQIFSKMGLVNAGLLIEKVTPRKGFFGKLSMAAKRVALGVGKPFLGQTIQEIQDQNREHRRSGTDVMLGQNIGHLPTNDWFSDRRFAQQQFTGTNPTTLTKASETWVQAFLGEATKQQKRDIVEQIKAADCTLYVQDCSYFRAAIGVAEEEVLVSDGTTEEAEGPRFACAPVSLFQLHPNGKLHPLAIVVDYRGSMEKSVTIFNLRPLPGGAAVDEAADWPWRYAKTCVQSADWIRHELTVHLVNTHLVEESIIVATNRSFEPTDVIYQLLAPHWYKTLPLNAAARQTLVPYVIKDLIGLKEEQVFNFVRHAYENFDFVGGYIPNDLRNRGFPPEELQSEKMKNYAYAKNMAVMWDILHKFVSSIIKRAYPDDTSVQKDEKIRLWYNELRGPGQMRTFPIINTVEELINAITMCIHIASPQHTAVNYLQAFYQCFVINKPPALFTPIPQSLDALQAFKESDLVDALPIGRERQWLLAAHVPYLLSFRASLDQNNTLFNYAQTGSSMQKAKNDAEAKAIREDYNTLCKDLTDLVVKFAEHSNGMDEGTIAYVVMDPKDIARSILI